MSIEKNLCLFQKPIGPKLWTRRFNHFLHPKLHQMKKAHNAHHLLLLIIIFSRPLFFLYGQPCDDANLYSGTSSIICNDSYNIINECIQGGEYQVVNVVAGLEYSFQTCEVETFDTQITLYDFNSNVLESNDDYCDLQSRVVWVANFTGQIKVLIDEYDCTPGLNDSCAVLSAKCNTPNITVCSNDNVYNNTSSVTCNGSNDLLSECILGGEYQTVNVVEGLEYTFQTCGTNSFDTQITLYDFDGNFLGYNDDYCGFSSEVTWIADFTGQIKVLVDEYNCLEGLNGQCALLFASCSNPPPCTNVPILECDTILTGQTTIGQLNEFDIYDYDDCSPNNTSSYEAPDMVYEVHIHQESQVKFFLEMEEGINLDLFLFNDCGTETGDPPDPPDCFSESVQDNNNSDIYTEVIDEILSPGTYFLVVDGATSSQQGAFNLTIACKCSCAEPAYAEPPGTDPIWENFEHYALAAIDPQSRQWRNRDILEPVISGDGLIANFQNNQVLHLEGEGEATDPAVFYRFRTFSSSSLSNSRFRVSWEIRIEEGHGGSYKMLYETPDSHGEDDYLAYEVFFFETGHGVLQIDDETVANFTYQPGEWTTVMHMIDFANPPVGSDGEVEFWVNYDFIHLAQLKAPYMDALEFFTTENNNYMVDNICVRSSALFCVQIETDITCVKNGEQWQEDDNACVGMYNFLEMEPCYSVCDQGGTLIYRGDAFSGSLDSTDTAPALLKSEPCVIEAFGGSPNTLYADIYVCYNETIEDLIISTQSNNENAKFFVFGCGCDPESGNDCGQVSLGQINGNGACEFDNTTNEIGFYYIAVLSTEPDDYQINVFPFGPCDDFHEEFNCGDTISGNLIAGNSKFEVGLDGDYSTCYNGNQSYDGNELIYRFDLTEPSFVNLELNTGSTEQMAIFLYSYLCGSQCIGYAETPPGGSIVTMDSVQLAQGVYYVVVDKNNGGSDNDFSLTLNCESDTDYFITFVDVNTPLPCPVDSSLPHDVRIQDNAVDEFPLDHYIVFTLSKEEDSRIVLWDQWAGASQQLFNVPKDSLGPPKCAYDDGDTLRIFVYYDNLSQSDNGGPCSIIFAQPGLPNVTADSFYTPGEKSFILDLVLEDLNHFNVQPSCIVLGSDSVSTNFQVVSDLPWVVEEDVDWITNVDPSFSTLPLPGVVSFDVAANPNQSDREALIRVIFGNDPPISRFVRVKQEGNCIEPLFSLETDVANPSFCEGEEITISPIFEIGSPDLYSYSWNTGDTTMTITDIPTSDMEYTVTITDINCFIEFNASIEVTLASPPSIDSIAITSVLCNGGSTGSLSIAGASGGTPNYIFEWSNGETGEEIDDLTAGTYSVTLTDQDGCTSEESIVLSEPDALQLNPSQTDITCNGAANGTAMVVPEGGTSSYSYLWCDGSNSNETTGLDEGTCSLTVTDANQCTSQYFFEIEEPEVLVADISSTNVTCNGYMDGSATANSTGGTAPYTYEWSNNIADTNHMIMNLDIGNYQVIIVDSNGCSAEASITITEPPGIVLTADVNDASCNLAVGAIDLDVVGDNDPFSYIWSNGATSQDIDNLASGLYTVTVSDSVGCPETLTIFVGNSNNFFIDTVIVDSITCHGGTDGRIDLSVMGGEPPYTYYWSNGDNNEDLDILAAGNYSVTIIDDVGCIIESNVIMVLEPDSLSIEAIVTNACENNDIGNINTMVSGGTPGYFFEWNTGHIGQNLTSLAPGDYQLTVVDAKECSKVHEIEVGLFEAPDIVTTPIDVLCHGDSTGSIDVQVTDGFPPFSYIWSNEDTTEDLNNLIIGTYELTLTDSIGCEYYSPTITIDEPSMLVTTTSNTATNCYGDSTGTAQLMAMGGILPYIFNWPDGDTSSNRTSLPAGEYLVTLSDGNECLDTIAFSIGSPEALSTNLNVNSACYGLCDGSIDINITGGTPPFEFTFELDTTYTNIFSINDLCPDDYGFSIDLTDANECMWNDSGSISISQNPLLEVTVDSTINATEPFYNNGAIFISVDGGTPPYQFQWIFVDSSAIVSNEEDPSDLVPGLYTALITDSIGCQITSPAIDMIVSVVEKGFYFNEFTIFPNPSNGQLSIMFTQPVWESISLELMNILGVSVPINFTPIEVGRHFTIDLSSFTSGVYLLKLSIGNELVLRKVILQKDK